MYEYTDHLGRCECGKIVPEADLVSITTDNDIELLICPDCATESER